MPPPSLAMQAKKQTIRSKRPLRTSDSEDAEEIEPFAQDGRRPNHNRFFGCLTTEPLIEWVLMEGNLEATENPVTSRYSLKTKAAVWEQCADHVTKKVQKMVQNDCSLAARAKKELEKITPSSGKREKEKKIYESSAAEWARGKVRHLASIVKRTHFYVYKRTGQGTLDGVDLDEQAERLCPHFANLRDVFDRIAALKGRTIDSDEETSHVGTEGEKEVKEQADPSSKKHKTGVERAQTVDRAVGELRALLTNHDTSSDVLGRELQSLRTELKLEREEHKKEREKYEAKLEKERENLLVRYEEKIKSVEDKRSAEIKSVEDKRNAEIKSIEEKHCTDRVNLVSAYESRIKMLENALGEERKRVDEERKLRDDMLRQIYLKN